MNPVIEILIILLLLLANGLFAMAEISVVSARKARLQQMSDEGNAQAGVALELANNPNQFLATVQIGITLVGILAGAFGGATIAQEIAALLEPVPWLAPYSQTIGVAIVVLAITYFSLVLGELVPKRLGLNNPERAASRLAVPMWTLSRLASPVVRFLGFSTNLVIRLLGVTPEDELPVTPEEIKVLIEQGKQRGEFEASEQDMIDEILQLDERRLGAFMTPRTQIIALDIMDPPEEIRRKIETGQHASFPVVRENLDNVLGVVRAMDLLRQSLSGKALDLEALMEPPLFVPESMSALKALELFKQKGAQSALITDEYGGIEGMLTHSVILEDIVGYIPSTEEPIEAVIAPHGEASQLLDGLMPIDEFKEIFNLETLPGEDRGLYQTVSGFVMTQLGSIPTEGQSFGWQNLCFEVVRMEGLRVDKVMATPLERDVPEEGCDEDRSS
jgi:putative hemolysin